MLVTEDHPNVTRRRLKKGERREPKGSASAAQRARRGAEG